MYGGTEKGIKSVTRMLEGKRSFVSSRPGWKDGRKEIGYGGAEGALVHLAQDVAHCLVL